MSKRKGEKVSPWFFLGFEIGQRRRRRRRRRASTKQKKKPPGVFSATTNRFWSQFRSRGGGNDCEISKPCSLDPNKASQGVVWALIKRGRCSDDQKKRGAKKNRQARWPLRKTALECFAFDFLDLYIKSTAYRCLSCGNQRRRPRASRRKNREENRKSSKKKKKKTRKVFFFSLFPLPRPCLRRRRRKLDTLTGCVTLSGTFSCERNMAKSRFFCQRGREREKNKENEESKSKVGE